MGLTRIRAQQISDIDYKQACRAVATTNVTLTGGAPAAVDGVSLQQLDRVLVTGQNTASENGFYFVQTLGQGENGTWVRTTDANETGEIAPGMIVMVTEGETYADTQWKLTTNGTVIVGTTDLNFVLNAVSVIGGSNTQIQYNAGGTLAGSANLTFANDELTVIGQANVSGNITTGNILTDGYYYANGEPFVAGSNYGDANVATFLGTEFGSNSISTTGNITGGLVDATGNVTGGNLVTGAQVVATGNITGGNLITAGLGSIGTTLDVTGNIAGGNLITAGLVSATGNITANYFVGNGSQLTGISGGSSTTISNGTSNVDIATANADITMSVAGVNNVVVVSTDGITVQGNVVGNGITTTTISSSPPENPEQGDIWIDSDTGVQLIYFNDGNSAQWAEMEAATSISFGSELDLSAVAQDIIPSANVTYSLGNATNRWANLFLAGNTIDLGGAQIKADAGSGAIALIPAATANVPNPAALVISVTGAVNTVETTGGELSGNAIAAAAAVTPPVTEMSSQLTGNYTIGNNYNAMTVGPITINTAGEITIPSGSNWIIL